MHYEQVRKWKATVDKIWGTVFAFIRKTSKKDVALRTLCQTAEVSCQAVQLIGTKCHKRSSVDRNPIQDSHFLKLNDASNTVLCFKARDVIVSEFLRTISRLPSLIGSLKPVPVAARSKTWINGRSPAEIVGSNPTGGMDVCLLRVLCVVRQRSLQRIDHSSRGVLPNVALRCK